MSFFKTFCYDCKIFSWPLHFPTCAGAYVKGVFRANYPVCSYGSDSQFKSHCAYYFLVSLPKRIGRHALNLSEAGQHINKFMVDGFDSLAPPLWHGPCLIFLFIHAKDKGVILCGASSLKQWIVSLMIKPSTLI